MTTPRRLLFEIRSAADGHVRAREPLDDDWEVIYEFASRDGALAVREIRVSPASDGLPLTPPPAARLRERLRPADVLSEARRVVLSSVAADTLAAFHGLAAEKIAKPKGRSRRPDYWYAAIAGYVAAATSSGSTRPRVDAAECLGPGWDARAIRDALTAAKSKGLWLPGEQGRRNGGRLSAAGLRVLRAGPPARYVGPVVGAEALGLIEAARLSPTSPGE